MIYEGIVLSLDRPHVDTDQIIPAHYLTGIDTAGLGRHLFKGMSGGDELLARYPGATVVVTRENFGCGSSREHAAWSLADRGFRAVIAPSFARIFYENAYNNGIAPIVVGSNEIDSLLRTTSVRVDLEAGSLTRDDGSEIRFDLDPLRKQFLLSGGYMQFLASKRELVRAWIAARRTCGPA